MNQKNKTLLSILFIFFSSCCSVPVSNEKDSDITEIKKLISKLSWNSIEIATTYGTSLKIIGREAIELEKIGKKVSFDLLKQFKEDEKSVVIHLILTNIWEPEVNFLKVMYTEIPETDNVLVEYRVNNFSWYESSDKNSRFSIDKVERDKIYEYWSKRIENFQNKNKL